VPLEARISNVSCFLAADSKWLYFDTHKNKTKNCHAEAHGAPIPPRARHVTKPTSGSPAAVRCGLHFLVCCPHFFLLVAAAQPHLHEHVV